MSIYNVRAQKEAFETIQKYRQRQARCPTEGYQVLLQYLITTLEAAWKTYQQMTFNDTEKEKVGRAITQMRIWLDINEKVWEKTGKIQLTHPEEYGNIFYILYVCQDLKDTPDQETVHEQRVKRKRKKNSTKQEESSQL